MTGTRVVQCFRCGYHYWPAQMRFTAPSTYVCADRKHCDFNIARRKADREAVGK